LTPIHLTQHHHLRRPDSSNHSLATKQELLDPVVGGDLATHTRNLPTTSD
jgi:hypothetical protein